MVCDIQLPECYEPLSIPDYYSNDESDFEPLSLKINNDYVILINKKEK